jgi:hypothetical protein
MELIYPLVASFLPRWLFGGATLVGSLLAALPFTSVVVRPFGRLYRTQTGTRSEELVGEECRVATGKVTDKFGQATVEDGGAGFLIQIRSRRENTLKKGDEVLIVDYDRERHFYWVEAVSTQSDSSSSRGRDPESPEDRALAAQAAQQGQSQSK